MFFGCMGGGARAPKAPPLDMLLDAVSRTVEEAHIKNVLKMNGYPESFINQTARRSSVKDKEEIEEKT